MMRMGTAIHLRAALAAAALLALAGCLFQGEGKSGGKGTGVRGRFVDSAGQPLAGVRVTAMPARDFRLAKGSAAAARGAARGAADSARTDASGRYALPALSSGEYNLVGVSGDGELAVLVPEVSYLESEGLLELGQDTLLAPGSIRGRVLRGGRGQEGALAYLPGTSYLAVSDSDGAFRVTGIPAGRYRVNYLVPGFQAGADTGIEVRAGLTARLPDKVLGYDTSLAPPAPSEPRAALDSVGGVVRLEWDRVPVEDLLGYLVYRDTGGASAPVLLTPRIHPETSFVDSLSEEMWAGRTSLQVTYRIRSVDRGKNPSLNFSPPLSLAASRRPPWPTEIVMEIFGLNDLGQAWRRDSVTMVLSFRNTLRPVRELAWKAEGNPPVAERVAVSGREGMITRRLSWSETGTWAVSAEAVDSVGDTTRVVRPVQVMEGVPFAYAGEDTTVSPRDSVWLRGQGWDVSGTTVGREWDIGATGVFVPAPEGRHSFVAPASAGRVACVYRVVDDEGWQASDTMYVEVIPDPPSARVTGPLNAFLGDTVRLSGAASTDGFGRIVAWEWDIGAQGRFAASSGPDTAFAATGADTTLICVLRVTDDDGMTSTAIHRIGLSGRDRWIHMGEAPFSVLDRFKAWEWDGMLWVEGPMRWSQTGERGLWRTRDMLTWTRVEPDPAEADWVGLDHIAAAEGPRLFAFSASFSERLPETDEPVRRIIASEDSRTWTPISAPASFWDRAFSAHVPLNGNLYFLGAFVAAGIGSVGEVWSARARDVARISDRAAFGHRSGMAAAAKDGKLWVYGGLVENQPDSSRVMNDVWSSSDGIAWTRVTDSALAQPSYGRIMVKQGNELWLLGGHQFDTDREVRDIWRSRDGVRWTRDPARLPDLEGFPVRYIVAFRDRIWIIAVYHDRNGVPRAGIWAAP